MSTMAATKLSSLRVWASTTPAWEVGEALSLYPRQHSWRGILVVWCPPAARKYQFTTHFLVSPMERRSEEHTSELQSLPTRRSSDLIVTIPTPAFMAGNFSGLVSASSAQIPIYDPLSSQPDGKEIGRAHV